MSKETFPSGYFITNAYDEYGHHSSVTDSKGYKIWEAKETDAFGRLTKYNQGGRTTTMYYDPTTGLPSSIVASSLINMSYIYDAKGQLESRSDGITGQKEVFTYDGLSRLDGWTLTRPGAALQSYNMIYDSKTGGIENKPNVAYTMKYGESANPPHSLTSIAGMPVELKDHAPQTISYNDFSKVSSISQDYKTYSLTYGTHRQRVKSVSEESGSTKQTKYYLGNYEEEVDAGGNIRKLHYIYGSNTLAAIMEHKSGQENLYYTYTDYQGNLMAVTDAAGKVKERYAYDPWGFRKNPTNWSVTDTRTSFLFSRGYTLHEHLDDFGLINMNGRVYDPLMAQFLSPDPYIQAPGSWMNYNRYAYCWNNPLIYTDPSGEFITSLFLGPVGVFIDAALWSGTINVVSNWKNIDNFGEGLAAFGAGATQGALTVANPALGSIVGGALTNATNSAIGQMESWDEFGSVDFGLVGKEALIGGIVGAAGYGTGKLLQKTNLPNKILDGLGVEKFGARNILGSGIVGTIGGTATGLTDGLARGAFYGQWDKVWERTWKGGAYGGAGGLVYGSVNQAGFELYKRTGNRRYANAGNGPGKGMEQGINASKQISQDGTGSGMGTTADGVTGNSVTVVAQRNGVHTVTVSMPNPIHGAVPLYSSYSYYRPSLYRLVNIYSLFGTR